MIGLTSQSETLKMKTKLTVLVTLLLSSLSFAQTTQPTIADTIVSITQVGANLTKIQAQLLASIPPGILKQPIVTPAPPATQQSIPAGTELSTFSFIANTTYIAAGDCTCQATWTPPATLTSVTINGNGYKLTGLETSGASTIIDARQTTDFKIYSFCWTAPSNATLFRPGTENAFVTNRILSGVSTVVECTYPNANGSAISGNIQDKPSGSRFCLIDGADDITIDGNQIAGSTGEDAVRAMPLLGGHVPLRGIIRGNTIKYASSHNKASISLRVATDFLIDGNTLTGWVRLGENSGTPTVLNVTITGNIFNPDPVNNDQVSFMAATGRVDGNTFRVNATQRPISGSGPSTNLQSADSNVKEVKAGVQAKQLINWGGVQSNGTNTKTVVIP